MNDLYRYKVYYNSTNDFNTATFLQYTYNTNNYPDFRELGLGSLIDNNNTLTALGLTYKSNGFFDLAFPYLYTSAANNDLIFNVLNHFPYYIACGIDLAPTGLTRGWVFITTDNSDCYFATQYNMNTTDYNIINYGSEFKYKNGNNLTGYSGTLFGCTRRSGSSLDKDWLQLYLVEYNPNAIQFIFDGQAGYNNTFCTSSAYNISATNSIYKRIVENDEPYVPQTDPYAGAGDSGTGGGGGSFDDSGDDIPIPNLPALSAANAGFITLFNPSVSQLNSLADYMWTNAAFDVANFKKIFEDPMDCILGLSIVPISVTTSGSADVAIGNMLISSIQFPVVSSQYQEFDCGSIPLTNLFFGGYLDYEPYTKIQIVVPYCGTFQISADDVIGKTINLVYHIDVLTGSCVAMLKCGNSVLYQFNGSCAVNIPINSINYASTIENATRIAVAIGTTVATAGAAAPAIMAGGEAAGAAQATLFNSAMNTAGATAEGALSMKPSIERSGALSSSSGMMSVQTPYIVITRPRVCVPKNQNEITGYPSFMRVTLSELTGQGYTEFDSVILSGLFLTDEEKGELDNILRSGVYL